MRLFTAIDLPEDMRNKLDDFLKRLRPLAKLRWSRAENLHITTKFIGEWTEARLDQVIAALKSVRQPEPPRISVHGVGCFPNARRPRVLWTGVEAVEPLLALARSTDQALATLGIAAEARDYSPHLTLARVKEPVPMEAILKAAGDPDFGVFQASSFFLYLSSNGNYSKLAEFPFLS